MKRVVVVVACLASFLVAKECKTMADLINGCVKTEYNDDKKPTKQSEWKNKKEVRVIYKKSYHNNGNLKSDCRGEGENKACKYYDENGEFEIEYRGGKPFHGKFRGDEEGEFVNGKKNGIWKRTGYNHTYYEGEYKDGKLIKFTIHNAKETIRGIIFEDEEYEYLGNEENISLKEAAELTYRWGKMRLVEKAEKADENVKNCVETLLPDKEGNTNPNSKITGCFIGKDKKIRDGLTTISIEMDMGIFLKDIRVLTFEVYFEKGKIVKEKSKCQYDWKKFEDTTKLEEILNSGKKYTAKTYYDILYAACN